MESMASREKNATVIMPTPIHIQPTPAARHTNRPSAVGRKSWTSPSAFMACETHNSPPVPAAMIRVRKTISSTSPFLRGSRMGMTDNEDAKANHNDARPAQQVHSLAKEKQPKNGHHRIGKSGSGLNVTVVRPGQDQHVGHEKGEQAGDAQPNVAGHENSDQDVKQSLRRPVLRRADGSHPFAKQDVAEGSK